MRGGQEAQANLLKSCGAGTLAGGQQREDEKCERPERRRCKRRGSGKSWEETQPNTAACVRAGRSIEPEPCDATRDKRMAKFDRVTITPRPLRRERAGERYPAIARFPANARRTSEERRRDGERRCLSRCGSAPGGFRLPGRGWTLKPRRGSGRVRKPRRGRRVRRLCPSHMMRIIFRICQRRTFRVPVKVVRIIIR